jgi:hypothetical protein
VGLGLGSAIMLDPIALSVSGLGDRDSVVHTAIWILVYEMVGGGWSNKNLVAGIGENWYRVEYIN